MALTATLSFFSLADGLLEIITLWVVQPVLILMLGIFIGKALQEFLFFLVSELGNDNSTLYALSYAASWAVYLFTLGYALSVVNLLRITLIFVASVIVLVLFFHLLLGSRDFLRNAWHFSAVRSKCKKGSILTTRYGEGKVLSIKISNTRIKMKGGEELFVPNRTMRLLLREKNSRET